jgi:hypothetical protein
VAPNKNFQKKISNTVKRLLGIVKPCPHLAVDKYGRCEDCSAWLPYYCPPERPSIKRASELSILAIEKSKTSEDQKYFSKAG